MPHTAWRRAPFIVHREGTTAPNLLRHAISTCSFSPSTSASNYC